MIGSHNSPYRQFAEHHCDLKSDDPYAFSGYRGAEFAQMRYREIAELLLNSGKRIESIIDIGAGPGQMWTWYMEQGYLDRMYEAGLRRLDLTDLMPECDEQLKDVKSKLEANYEGIEVQTRTGIDMRTIPVGGNYVDMYDVVMEVGALNYYNAIELPQIIQMMIKLSRKLTIVETNLQSPETTVMGGIINPSIDQLYQIFYSLLLGDGKNSITTRFFKKWTSVWMLDVEVKA